jgi:hypothetical protein
MQPIPAYKKNDATGRRLDPMKQKPDRRRCDACTRHSPAALDRARRAGPAALGKYMRRERCKNWALPGGKRCRLHGGHSTGPVTPKGRARTLAAMGAGRAKWLAELKAEGKPIPCGRKKRGRNRSPEERAQASYEK